MYHEFRMSEEYVVGRSVFVKASSGEIALDNRRGRVAMTPILYDFTY